jgi:AcrR family transcriptional regulator
MLRAKRSEHTRRLVLDAALELFSHRGYRATTMRDIADAAAVSTGNVYHHFPDKEAIFRTLLDEYHAITRSTRFPLTRALQNGRFPENLEQIGRAARESVEQYRSYMALHYVDVIEFEGEHIRNFYTDLTALFATLIEERDPQLGERMRDGVPPISALMASSRLFLNLFQLEILFGVPEPYGKHSMEVVEEIADILRNGIAKHVDA